MAPKKRYRGRALTKAMPAPMAEEVREEAFAGYHIYKIPFRETIANKQQKQILFLQKNRVPCRQYGNQQYAPHGLAAQHWIGTVISALK